MHLRTYVDIIGLGMSGFSIGHRARIASYPLKPSLVPSAALQGGAFNPSFIKLTENQTKP